MKHHRGQFQTYFRILTGQIEALFRIITPHPRRQSSNHLANPTDWQNFAMCCLQDCLNQFRMCISVCQTVLRDTDNELLGGFVIHFYEERILNQQFAKNSFFAHPVCKAPDAKGRILNTFAELTWHNSECLLSGSSHGT